MKGLQVRGDLMASILDDGRTSLVGQTIPDPATMATTRNRYNALETDRMNLSRRMFTNSGMMMTQRVNGNANLEEPLSPTLSSLKRTVDFARHM